MKLKTTHTIKRIDSHEGFVLAKEFVNKNHSYIKWADRPSRKVYWLCYEDGRLIGVFGLSSAFVFPKVVKEFMTAHNLKFNEIANNSVFCLSGAVDKNSGSRLLSLLRKDASKRWMERYGDELKALQTFIMPPRTGAVYKADNWVQIGKTTGGRSLKTLSILKRDLKKYKTEKIDRRVFKDGTVKYLLRSFVETTPKIIFVKLFLQNKKRQHDTKTV